MPWIWSAVIAVGIGIFAQRPLPTLEGYRLGTARGALPRDMPCSVQFYGLSCRPVDSLSLRFTNDSLFYVGVTTIFTRTNCATPLAEWRARWNALARRSLGMADSGAKASVPRNSRT